MKNPITLQEARAQLKACSPYQSIKPDAFDQILAHGFHRAHQLVDDYARLDRNHRENRIETLQAMQDIANEIEQAYAHSPETDLALANEVNQWITDQLEGIREAVTLDFPDAEDEHPSRERLRSILQRLSIKEVTIHYVGEDGTYHDKIISYRYRDEPRKSHKEREWELKEEHQKQHLSLDSDLHFNVCEPIVMEKHPDCLEGPGCEGTLTWDITQNRLVLNHGTKTESPISYQETEIP